MLAYPVDLHERGDWEVSCYYSAMTFFIIIIIILFWSDFVACRPANDVEQFQEEVDRWLVRWNIAAIPKPSTISETLAVINCEFYPNIYVCLLVLVTMPVTTATAERSFSVMRRVKMYVRSTMLTERLSALFTCLQHT